MQSEVESLLEQFKTSMEGERMLDNKLGILVKYIKQMNVKEQFDMCHEKLLKNKEALYLEYKHNELSSLRSQRKYLKIFFHIVLRKMLEYITFYQTVSQRKR